MEVRGTDSDSVEKDPMLEHETQDDKKEAVVNENTAPPKLAETDEIVNDPQQIDVSQPTESAGHLDSNGDDQANMNTRIAGSPNDEDNLNLNRKSDNSACNDGTQNSGGIRQRHVASV